MFLKLVLDFQLREHEKFLSRFVKEFRSVDADNDGVIDEASFRGLMKRLKLGDKVESFLITIDPYNNQKVTFSECVHLLSQETVKTPDGQECAVLELISATL